MKVRRHLREKTPVHVWVMDEQDDGKIKMDVTFNVTVTIEIEPETTYSELVEEAAPHAAEKLRNYPLESFQLCEPSRY